MKIYLQVNDKDIITGIYSKKLFDDVIPYEVDNISKIHVGLDKFVNGSIVENTAAYEQEQENLRRYNQIQELKQHLAETDFQAIKFAEGELTEEEFAPVRAQRHAWREEIRRLENN